MPRADIPAPTKKCLPSPAADMTASLSTSHCQLTLRRSSLVDCGDGGAMAGQGMWRGVALIVLAVLLAVAAPMQARAQRADDLDALSKQVEALSDQGNYAEATETAKRLLALAEKKFGSKHPRVGTSLDNLATLYRDQGRYAEAEPLQKRALAIYEKALRSDHPDVGISLNNLAELYRAQGRYAEAEPLYKRSLAIREKALGPDHPDVGSSLNNLALLYQAQGRTAEAEPLYKRALAIDEKALGPDHPDVGIDLNNLATLYQDQGRYAEAEPLYKRSLAIREMALGPDHPKVGTALNNLAELYQAQGRFFEAEPLYKHSLAIREKVLSPDHPNVGTALNNLAELYRAQGRIAEAEPLYKRALSIYEKALGSDHRNVGQSLNNLALLYQAQGRIAEAEPLHKRALAIYEKALGPDHPDVAQSLDNLASLYQAQGRFLEAGPLHKRALAIYEKSLGSDHPDVGKSLNNLASLYQAQSRFFEAEPLYKRALAIYEKALGSDHPDVGTSLNNLAGLYFVERDWSRAAEFWRRSTGIIERRARRDTSTVGQPLTGGGKSEATQLDFEFFGLVKSVYRLATEGHDPTQEQFAEAFEAAQWAHASEAASSLAQMAARGAKGDPKLAAIVRERQDLVAEWQKRDSVHNAAVSQPPDKRDRAAESANTDRLAAIDTRIAAIDERLKADFPDYASLASVAPLSVADLQAQLRPHEALVLFLDTPERNPTPEETFIWVVTKTEMRWARSKMGTKALTERVWALRCGLDATLWDKVESAKKCEAALGAEPRTETVTVGSKDERTQVLPFDLARAHELYKALLGPVEDMIQGKRLLIMPSGPLTSLPFNVLVTESPQRAVPATLADYRDVAWLGARMPLTMLPSVASLKSLRQFARMSRATKPYLGIGNPLLDGQQDDPVWSTFYKEQADLARKKRCSLDPTSQQVALARGPRSVRGIPSLFRGTHADIEQIRACSPLPETADELCEVARRLNAPESDILLGANATETRLKELSAQGRLADYAILHFATHGALTGEVQGSAEPGLILTPPPKGTSDAQALERDDGFLTASEIATLKLDADWVVLSACNTAGAQGEGAEALSGMARAFFYAGARALLVSHWEVGSKAAVKLTTRAFAELKTHPNIGRGEALRVSMKELIEKGSLAEAHPSQWGPFVVVGEGAAFR